MSELRVALRSGQIHTIGCSHVASFWQLVCGAIAYNGPSVFAPCHGQPDRHTAYRAIVFEEEAPPLSVIRLYDATLTDAVRLHDHMTLIIDHLTAEH